MKKWMDLPDMMGLFGGGGGRQCRREAVCWGRDGVDGGVGGGGGGVSRGVDTKTTFVTPP